MDYPSDDSPRLNLFALPNQTAFLFGLITTVLLGALWLGGLGTAPVGLWPLALGLLLLTLRAFLARSYRDIHQRGLSSAGPDLQVLKDSLAAHAHQLGLKRVPQLYVAPGGLNEIQTFGTFRHWFIATGHEAAQEWQRQLVDPQQAPAAQAVIIHELYHFKTGDYWQLGLVEQLLHLTLSFLGWATAFLTGYGLLLALAQNDLFSIDFPQRIRQIEALPPELAELFISQFPSAAVIEEMQAKLAEISILRWVNFVLTSLIPFVLIAGVLRSLFWPKLWRMRELYADAGAVHAQGRILPWYASLLGWDYQALSEDRQGLDENIHAVLGRKISLLDRLRSLGQTHPDGYTRFLSVLRPEQAFDPWPVTAILVGSLVLVLDILLVSPLTLIITGAFPMHFSTLVALVMVTIQYVVPRIASGQPAWQGAMKVAAVVAGVRLLWLLITLGVFLMLAVGAPDYFSDMLAEAVASAAHYAGRAAVDSGTPMAFLGLASVVNLLQVLLIALVLGLSLISTAQLLICFFTWYRLPNAQARLAHGVYLITGASALAWGTVVMLPLTLLLIRPGELATLENLLVVGGGLVTAGAGLWWFWRLSLKYSGLCPHCGCQIPGAFYPGKTCPGCSEKLFPWLAVEYRL